LLLANRLAAAFGGLCAFDPIAFFSRVMAFGPLFLASVTLLISFVFRTRMERAARLARR
jgi:hypothetical protein